MSTTQTPSELRKKPSGIIKILRVILVLSILVLFPIISFVFLWEGVTNRKAELEKMSDHGVLSVREFQLNDGSVLYADSLLGSVVVMWLPDSFDVALSGKIDSLLTQFASSGDFILGGLYTEGTKRAWENWEASTSPDKAAFFLGARPEELIPQGSPLEAVGCSSASCPGMILIDRSGTVRRVVNPYDRGEMVSLVKQIAILIARPRTFEKPQVIREKEK